MNISNRFSTYCGFSLFSKTRGLWATVIVGIFIFPFPGWGEEWVAINRKNEVNFISTYPTQETGTFSKRSKPQLTVQRDSKKGDVISVFVGYTLDEDKMVKVSVYRKDKVETFEFFPHGEWAYVATDKKVIDAMKLGTELTVEATSNKGTTSKDTYSLMGFVKALNNLS